MKKNFTILMLLAFCCLGLNAKTVTDVLTPTSMGLSHNSSYDDYTGIKITSDALYNAKVMRNLGNENVFQFRTNYSNTGIVTSKSGGVISSVSVKFFNSTSTTPGSSTIQIYYSNESYSTPADLFNQSINPKEIVCNGEYTGEFVFDSTDKYNFIGIRSKSGAIYVESIAINWTVKDEPVTFTPAAGEVKAGTEVTMSCEEDAEIYYTTDGTTTPTTESTKYDENNPVVINEDVTIKAIAYKGGKASEVVTAQYTVLPYIESLIALADAPSGAKFEMGTKLTVVYSDYYKEYNYVYDGTSYSLIFKPGGLALKSGDVINAGWIGKYEINSEGRPQIEPQETIVVIEEGADIPEPAEVTENEFDQLLIEGNANQYYILKNVYIDENAVENYAYWGDEYRGQMGTKYPILYSKTLGVRPYAAGYYDVTGFVDVNYNASYGGYYARLLPTKLDQYIEIGDAKMATFSSKYPLDFTKSDVRAYIATESTGNAVKFERIYKVPAKTGLLLQTDAKGVYYVPNLSDDDTPETFGTNYMKDAVEKTYVYDTDWVFDYDTYEYIIYTNYLLAYDKDNVGTVAFHPIKTNSYYVLDGGKAYLSLLPSTTSESGQMRIVFDDEEATGIEAVNCEEVESGDAYNLQGIKVDSNYKGFVIKNGAKFYNR